MADHLEFVGSLNNATFKTADADVPERIPSWIQGNSVCISEQIIRDVLKIGDRPESTSVLPLVWVSPNEQFPEGASVSGRMDTLVLVWILATGEKVQTLKGHKIQVTGVAIDNVKAKIQDKEGIPRNQQLLIFRRENNSRTTEP